MKLTRSEAEYLLFDAPVIIGQQYGFTKLTGTLHNRWIRDMVVGTEDKTLQAHRGSYKTTCVSIALATIMVGCPYEKTMFTRKTDSDVKEIIAQVKKILLSDVMQAIVYSLYGFTLELTTDSATEISTNLAGSDPRGTSQLVAFGMGSSLTGKHFDRIFTDDIVNVKDRTSRAERNRTKIFYQELQNIRNRGGRIYNTGTPWHKDDCFTLMPNPEKWDCHNTGLISRSEMDEIRRHMTASLFSANYELKHIASEDVIFSDPVTGADMSNVEQGVCHVDAAYGGEDFTAFTICKKKDGKYFILGKLWRMHIDDVEDTIIDIRKSLNAGRISCEDNGDKGYLGKSLRKKGERTHVYHESMNKFLKITSYLKSVWDDVVFVNGTDQEYIDQVVEYNENAEHDDAPDSLASIIRELWNKKEKADRETVGRSYFL